MDIISENYIAHTSLGPPVEYLLYLSDEKRLIGCWPTLYLVVGLCKGGYQLILPLHGNRFCQLLVSRDRPALGAQRSNPLFILFTTGVSWPTYLKNIVLNAAYRIKASQKRRKA